MEPTVHRRIRNIPEIANIHYTLHIIHIVKIVVRKRLTQPLE